MAMEGNYYDIQNKENEKLEFLLDKMRKVKINRNKKKKTKGRANF